MASFPNEARPEARAQWEACLLDPWAARASDGRPASCPLSRAEDYPFTSLEADITDLACQADPGHPGLEITVWADISGDTGCSPHNLWRIVLATNCPVARADEAGRGNILLLPDTRPPGNDIRTTDLPQPDWRPCASACEAEPECRAWTFREPTASHVPFCLLKRAAGTRVEDTCLTSGLME
jgi:hypothetical protein